jgi:hypothetical protein
MTTVPLVGVFPSAIGSHVARLVQCRVEPKFGHDEITSNVPLDPTLQEALRKVAHLVAQDAKDLGWSGSAEPLGIYLDVDTNFALKRLEDDSYGLPVYAAAVAALCGFSVSGDVVGTGTVEVNGALGKVTALVEKSTASAGAVFVYSATKTNSRVPRGIPVDTALAGASLWWGLDLLHRAAEVTETGDLFLLYLDAYLSGHRGAAYRRDTGLCLLKLASTHPCVGQAFTAHRDRWAFRALRHADELSEIHFWDLLQLLDPRAPVQDTWQSPDKRESLLVETIDALQGSDGIELADVVSCVHRLVHVTRGSVDLTLLLQTESRFRAAVVGLLNRVYATSPRSRDLERRCDELGRTIETLASIPSAGTHLPTRHPQLQIEPNYDATGFSALRFTFPDAPHLAASTLDAPAALFDVSSGLPDGLRRSNWTPADSALNNAAHGDAICSRFGVDNLFAFPSFLENGIRTEILWGDGTGTWPPSIDTLHLVAVMRDEGIFDRSNRYRRVLDLGCGTGVHGLLVARNTEVDEFTFIDSEPGARITTTHNVFRNLHPDGAAATATVLSDAPTSVGGWRVRFLEMFARSAHELSRKAPYDLTICTPPYVPFVDILRAPGMWQAVAGTSLLQLVLEHHARFSRKTVVQFSEIALPEVEPLLAGMEPVARHLVGFRIPPLTEYFDSMSPLYKLGEIWREQVEPYLVDTETSTEPHTQKHHHGFKYFHWIRTYILEA